MKKNYLIKKWLENDLTSEEQKAFDALEEKAFLNEIIQEGKRFKGQNTSKVTSFENLEKGLHQKPKSTKNWTKTLVRIAAVFVIGFGLYSLFDKDKHSTFETQLAQTEQITLPDNSMVTLNELSQLNFNDDWSKERNVKLKGEAYFKVAKGNRFDVNTEFGTVSVLGTQFNVIARDSIFSVICYEGLVQVLFNNKITKLPAGKAYRIINGAPEAFDITVIQPEWLRSMRVFEQASIGDVFASIESHYNITIVADDIDNSILFTGAFELDNLDNALKATTKSLNLTYEINSKNVVVIRNAEE
ncbi:MAG: FecR domain-containing protein [Flavobacteriaceae bacterium]|nr:FecR domain-containing protein [Flavobacteriaceae bacterium]